MLPKVLLLCLLLSAGFEAWATPCPQQPLLLVETTEADLLSEICSSADHTFAFLNRFGLEPRRAIHFGLVEAKITCCGADAFGSYDSRSDRIALMTYAAILAGSNPPRMYDEPFDRDLYAGVIAHEITHAVVQHNLQREPTGVVPQEYLAHATQLAVLPAARRERIIRALNVAPWESGDVISDLYMSLEPSKFAVKSYLHLTGMNNPRDFVDILLRSNWSYIYVP